MLLAGEAEAEENAPGLRFAFFDPFANRHFLLAGEQGHLAHLAQIHLHRVVQNIQAAFLLLLHRFHRFGPLQIGRLHDFHLEAPQFGINRVQHFRRHHLVGQGVVDVVVSQVTLVLRDAQKVLDLLDDDGRIHRHRSRRQTSGGRTSRRRGRVMAVAGQAVAVFCLAAGLSIEAKARLFRHRPLLAGGGKGLAKARAFHQVDSLSGHNILTPFQDLGSLKDGNFCRLQIPQKKARFRKFGTPHEPHGAQTSLTAAAALEYIVLRLCQRQKCNKLAIWRPIWAVFYVSTWSRNTC